MTYILRPLWFSASYCCCSWLWLPFYNNLSNSSKSNWTVLPLLQKKNSIPKFVKFTYFLLFFQKVSHKVTKTLLKFINMHSKNIVNVNNLHVYRWNTSKIHRWHRTGGFPHQTWWKFEQNLNDHGTSYLKNNPDN